MPRAAQPWRPTAPEAEERIVGWGSAEAAALVCCQAAAGQPIIPASWQQPIIGIAVGSAASCKRPGILAAAAAAAGSGGPACCAVGRAAACPQVRFTLERAVRKCAKTIQMKVLGGAPPIGSLFRARAKRRRLCARSLARLSHTATHSYTRCCFACMMHACCTHDVRMMQRSRRAVHSPHVVQKIKKRRRPNGSQASRMCNAWAVPCRRGQLAHPAAYGRRARGMGGVGGEKGRTEVVLPGSHAVRRCQGCCWLACAAGSWRPASSKRGANPAECFC